ncbi:MAG: RNA polymerase sigma factor RpoH [Oligoflexia bacterium]|nr:MAG: RNA polymerase sigma factor RpoH [Oligoflexia bacterium]
MATPQKKKSKLKTKTTAKPQEKIKKPKVAQKLQPKKAKKVHAEVVDEDIVQPQLSYHEDESLYSSEPVSDTKALTPSDPVALYLAEVRKYPLLSKEQELELAKNYYETKDPKAAQALVTANLRFVVKIAAEYSKFGARMIDLIQEGNMGLMHAVKDFNPYKGVRLITYAVWWIRGYIQEYLMKQYSMVKIGTTQNQKKLFYQLQREKKQLDALGEKPDVKLISQKLGIPEDEIEEMSKRMSGRDVSLDQPLSDDSGVSLKDFQSAFAEAPDELLSREEEISRLKDRIEKIRPTLNEKETIILEERLLADDPLTLQEIGEKYGITREAVRQAEARLMKKIKDQFTEKV